MLHKKSTSDSPSSSPSKSGFQSLRMTEDSRSDGGMDSSAFRYSHTSLVTGKLNQHKNSEIIKISFRFWQNKSKIICLRNPDWFSYQYCSQILHHRQYHQCNSLQVFNAGISKRLSYDIIRLLTFWQIFSTFLFCRLTTWWKPNICIPR